MLQIRRSVFETNSSSVHSMTMCSKDEYDKWKDGDLYYCDDFITREKAVEIVEEERMKWDRDKVGLPIDDAVLVDHEIYSYGEFWDKYGDWYETFFDEYTTESGETVVAFGYFGHD